MHGRNDLSVKNNLGNVHFVFVKDAVKIHMSKVKHHGHQHANYIFVSRNVADCLCVVEHAVIQRGRDLK